MTRDTVIIAAVVLLTIASLPLLIHSDEGRRATLKRVAGGTGIALALALLVYWVARF